MVASWRFDHLGPQQGCIDILMSYEPRVLVLNARGLNDRARRSSVRRLVGTTSASIVCIQQTNLSVVTLSIVMETLDAEFDGYFCLPAIGRTGGIIIAWVGMMVRLENAYVNVN